MINNIIYNPGVNWVGKLRKGNKIWLVKESEYAYVEDAYYPPADVGTCGELLIRFGNYRVNRWFMDLNGCGIDRKPLIAPVKNNLATNPEPIEEPEVRKLQRKVNDLENRLRVIEDIHFRELSLYEEDLRILCEIDISDIEKRRFNYKDKE